MVIVEHNSRILAHEQVGMTSEFVASDVHGSDGFRVSILEDNLVTLNLSTGSVSQIVKVLPGETELEVIRA